MSYVREVQPNIFVAQDSNAAISVVKNGEPIVFHPPDVWKSWSKTKQEEAGIFEYVPFEVPVGMVKAGNRRFQRVDGMVKEAYDVATGPLAETITRRQLLIALWKSGLISSEESIDAAQSGTVPAFIKSGFDRLPENERIDAYITFATMNECYRNDPIFTAIASKKNFSELEMDNWWSWAGTL